MTTSKRMRDLDPEDIDTLVSLKGMIIRTSSIIPEVKEGLSLSLFSSSFTKLSFNVWSVNILRVAHANEEKSSNPRHVLIVKPKIR
jgi:hypothetical protein